MKWFTYAILCSLLVVAGTLPLQFTHATSHDSPVVDDGDDTPVVEFDPVTIENPLQAKNITELFAAIIDVVLVFAIPIIVFFIIYAGFLYVTARGNENTIQKAHMALLYALIGGLIILGARVLIDVVKGTVEQVTGEETSEI
jgi:hypothetical protein